LGLIYCAGGRAAHHPLAPLSPDISLHSTTMRHDIVNLCARSPGMLAILRGMGKGKVHSGHSLYSARISQAEPVQVELLFRQQQVAGINDI
jgi:hypothetical protein